MAVLKDSPMTDAQLRALIFHIKEHLLEKDTMLRAAELEPILDTLAL